MPCLPENIEAMIKILSGDVQRVRGRRRLLVNDFLTDNDPLCLEDIDLEDSPLEIAEILSSLATTSLFNPRKMVVLRNLSRRADLRERVADILAGVADGVSLVIVEGKLDKKTSFGKFLSGHPAHQEYRAYQGAELESWLVEVAAARQSRLSRSAAAYLIQQVGSDSLALGNEIRKLSVYPEITRELIDRLVLPVPSSQIFDLLDALMRGDLTAAVRLYDDQRQQKNEPLSILGIFVWQLRILLVAKKAGGSNIVAEFGINQFALRKAQALAANMSMAQLGRLIDLCRRTDERIRREFINPDEALRYLIFRGCYLKRAAA
ncbi:DNA polymerase III subunit delta [Candidatus Saccharibacteria bacterium]|nr:DNA polymerase III subunit delta [Candidatus Saccharibacteria bacterium]